MPLLVLSAGNRGVKRGRSFRVPKKGAAKHENANDNYNGNEECSAGGHVQITQHTNSAATTAQTNKPL